MSKRILIGAYEVPGWGGASTSSYRLFERLQRDGLEVDFVNLVHPADTVYFRYLFGERFGNPAQLDNVFTCTLDGPAGQAQPSVVEVIRARSPDLLVGYGMMATTILKRAAPALPNVFLTAGSFAIQRLIETGAVRDFVDFEQGVRAGEDFSTSERSVESDAVAAADLIVTHSPIVRFAFEALYPRSARRIYTKEISVADLLYPEAERFADLRRTWAERDIDVLFVANNWDRPVKNRALVQAIAERCRGLALHLVGERQPPSLPVVEHGLITERRGLYELLGRSRTLVCPSLLDAAPGVLFEASAMGCNVIASRNCGNAALCHAELLAPECTRDAFVRRIELARQRPYADNRHLFRGSHDDLVATLSVFQ